MWSAPHRRKPQEKNFPTTADENSAPPNNSNIVHNTKQDDDITYGNILGGTNMFQTIRIFFDPKV